MSLWVIYSFFKKHSEKKKSGTTPKHGIQIQQKVSFFLAQMVIAYIQQKPVFNPPIAEVCPSYMLPSQTRVVNGREKMPSWPSGTVHPPPSPE